MPHIESTLTPDTARAWAPLLELLGATPPEQLLRWESELQRRLKDNGSTYRSLPDGPDVRDWQMDPLPMVLASAEWDRLEQGIIERAGNVEALLTDLMGAQTQVKRGGYDPRLLFSDPDYLLAAHDVAGERPWLRFLAMDLGRDADGEWRVYGDISRPPGGLGYVLERRITLARVFGFLTRRMPMRRVASFFQAFRAAVDDTLATRAGHAVMLTPGQHHPSYFEHAFLANYLDLTLAQGEDLTVRDGQLWLKTLDGLQPVSMVLRRVLDAFTDPLAFDDNSRLGTPGIGAVLRAGRVDMWNPPGAGLIDSPGFLSQLDHLYSSPLKSAETLPLMQPENVELVRQNPAGFVFRVLGGQGREGVLYQGGEPGLEAIWANPNGWVAQRRLTGSRIPASQQGQVGDVNALIRVYAVRGPNGWTAMPGGLVRYVENDVATLQASSRAAIGVKDLWVMGEGQGDAAITITTSAKPAVVNSDPGAVPSRVADALYWMGRYAERLEFIGRLLREVLQRVLEERQSVGPDNAIPGLPLLLSGVALGSQMVDVNKPEAQLSTILTHADHPVGLHRALDGLLANARAVPDYLSPDAWRLLVRLEKNLQSAVGLQELPVGQQIERLDQVLMLLSATNGLVNDTMTRSLGYRFLDIGRHLERGLQTCALLRDAASPIRRNELGFWEMVLGITDTTMTYKRRYRSSIHAGAVVDMLLLDDSTPRALAYQLRRLGEQIDLLPGSVRRGTLPVQQRLALEARTAIQLADPDELMTPEGQPRAVLTDMLAQTERRLLALSETLTLRYFNHAEIPHRLTKVST